jgi:hypothetical protein
MEENREQKCASIGMKVSLLCITLAFMGPLAYLITISYIEGKGIPYLTDLRGYSVKDVLIALGGMVIILGALYTSAIFFGRGAGKRICEMRLSVGGAIFVGIGLAFCCLAVAAVTVELTVFLTKLFYAEAGAQRPTAASGYGILILMIMLFGALPTILLGVVYGIVARWRLAKAGCIEEG